MSFPFWVVFISGLLFSSFLSFFFFFLLSFSFLGNFIPAEQLFIAHMGGGGGGRGNGRPLTTAYSSFGPSFQLWYLWTVVILVIIRPSNGNMKTRDTLKFSIAAASVLYSLKDVCRVVAEMWCGVFFCQENGLFMLPLKFIVSLLPHSVGAGWDSHWQIAFCSCCDLWRYSEVILTCHQRTDSKPFGFLQGCP